MNRLASLLVLGLYVAAQGGFLLHGEDVEAAACEACPNAGPALTADCSDGDCDAPSHHHHRHAEHHPGSCRVCGASGASAPDPVLMEAAGLSVRRDEDPLKSLRHFTLSLHRAARAPPANA